MLPIPLGMAHHPIGCHLARLVVLLLMWACYSGLLVVLMVQMVPADAWVLCYFVGMRLHGLSGHHRMVVEGFVEACSAKEGDAMTSCHAA